MSETLTELDNLSKTYNVSSGTLNTTIPYLKQDSQSKRSSCPIHGHSRRRAASGWTTKRFVQNKTSTGC